MMEALYYLNIYLFQQQLKKEQKNKLNNLQFDEQFKKNILKYNNNNLKKQNNNPDGTIFQYRFYRESCIQIEERLYIKDLRIIGNRKLENMLIINNESYSYSYQLDNGIPIVPCYDNKYDKELIFLTDYLMNLKQCEQLVNQNRMHSRTYLYQMCNNGEECLKEMFQAHDVILD